MFLGRVPGQTLPTDKNKLKTFRRNLLYNESRDLSTIQIFIRFPRHYTSSRQREKKKKDKQNTLVVAPLYNLEGDLARGLRDPLTLPRVPSRLWLAARLHPQRLLLLLSRNVAAPLFLLLLPLLSLVLLLLVFVSVFLVLLLRILSSSPKVPYIR
jgi:hypothetical protein